METDKKTPLNKETIHIVCAFDDKFLILFFGLLGSLIENHKSKEPLVLHILSDNIQESSKNIVNQAIDIELHWIEISEDSYLEIHEGAGAIDLSAHYARFLIPHVLKEISGKVIYLDTDTLVLGDISELWRLPLHGNSLGAVHDANAQVNDPWMIPNSKELGLKEGAKYFNSGVLLIDLDLWRDQNITWHLIQCIIENKEFLRFQDQYAFNVVFHEKWTELPKSWNHMQYTPLKSKIDLVHFVSWEKPALKASNGFYHHLFYHYLDKISHENWKIYTRLHEVDEIKIAVELPQLLQQLNISYHPDYNNVHRGIVVEPEEGPLSHILLDNDPNLSLVRIFLDSETSEKDDTGASSGMSRVEQQMQVFGKRVSVMQPMTNLHRFLVLQSFGFVYLDMNVSLIESITIGGGLYQFLYFGGLMCGTCTQETPLLPEDFHGMKFLDQSFDWKTKDIRIHHSPTHSNRWFWYFLRTY